MGLRINEINNNESYEIKTYTSSKKDKDDVGNAARVFCGEFEVTAWSNQRLDKANTVYNALP